MIEILTKCLLIKIITGRQICLPRREERKPGSGKLFSHIARGKLWELIIICNRREVNYSKEIYNKAHPLYSQNNNTIKSYFFGLAFIRFLDFDKSLMKRCLINYCLMLQLVALSGTFQILKLTVGLRELTHQLRECTPGHVLNMIPSTWLRQLTMTCYSSFRESYALYWPLWANSHVQKDIKHKKVF